MPMKTEITPLLIMTRLEQFDYAGATALALVMLVVSFAILLAINSLTWRAQGRRSRHPQAPAGNRVGADGGRMIGPVAASQPICEPSRAWSATR